MDSHFRQHLSVDFYVSQFQAVHQSGVGQIIQAGACIDTCDPEFAHIAFQFSAVIVCVFEAVHYLLIGGFVQGVLGTKVTFGQL